VNVLPFDNEPSEAFAVTVYVPALVYVSVPEIQTGRGLAVATQVVPIRYMSGVAVRIRCNELEPLRLFLRRWSDLQVALPSAARIGAGALRRSPY